MLRLTIIFANICWSVYSTIIISYWDKYFRIQTLFSRTKTSVTDSSASGVQFSFSIQHSSRFYLLHLNSKETLNNCEGKPKRKPLPSQKNKIMVRECFVRRAARAFYGAFSSRWCRRVLSLNYFVFVK